MTTFQQQEEQLILYPNDLDILCGSGRSVSTHPGNKRFRIIVGNHYAAYSEATSKVEKMKVTQRVMDALLSSGSTRFLKKDPIFERFHLTKPRAGRDKISHCLREIKLKQARRHTRRSDGSPSQLADSQISAKKILLPPSSLSLLNPIPPSRPSLSVHVGGFANQSCTKPTLKYVAQDQYYDVSLSDVSYDTVAGPQCVQVSNTFDDDFAPLAIYQQPKSHQAHQENVSSTTDLQALYFEKFWDIDSSQYDGPLDIIELERAGEPGSEQNCVSYEEFPSSLTVQALEGSHQAQEVSASVSIDERYANLQIPKARYPLWNTDKVIAL